MNKQNFLRGQSPRATNPLQTNQKKNFGDIKRLHLIESDDTISKHCSCISNFRMLNKYFVDQKTSNILGVKAGQKKPFCQYGSKLRHFCFFNFFHKI